VTAVTAAAVSLDILSAFLSGDHDLLYSFTRGSILGAPMLLEPCTIPSDRKDAMPAQHRCGSNRDSNPRNRSFEHFPLPT
jgi:hypothetical protein